MDRVKELEQKIEDARRALSIGKHVAEMEVLDLEYKNKFKIAGLEIDLSRAERDLAFEKRMREIADESSKKLAVELTDMIKRSYGG
jgi:hypothetical protein